ncbi:MAG: LytTR family DNA-binding domain-containing protein [Wenzhouxiangellaceae bacterium]|nr:LytTR family DNA-binding domain-containing protein [Wenzhouxiangellaceae bacterium]
MRENAVLDVFIVDDEPPAVERLSELVASLPGRRVVGCESRADRVLERCRALRPDVVLLDIEMPGQGGLALARDLAQLQPAPAIVFVTAHDEFALEAFGVAARDYLVKPVRRERLADSLVRLEPEPDPAHDIMIGGRIGERRVRIPLAEVRAFTAEDKCTLVHAVGRTALVDEPLKTLEARLGEQFLRVHRNALVSRAHVRALYTDNADAAHVELDGCALRPEVSRRNRSAVRALVAGDASPQSKNSNGDD